MLATVLALALGQSAPLENLDFSRGDLSGWEGSGFYLTAGSPLGPRGSFGACSSDAGSPQRTGMLRYAFSVPNNASVLRFQAFAATRPGFNADSRLDVVLAGVDGRAVPKNVRASSGWTSAVRLLPRWQGKARDYSWDVGAYAGETMQVVLIDRDDRPGHYLHAANFRFEATHQFHDRDFADFMAELQAKHNLPPVARYDSRRFTDVHRRAAPQLRALPRSVPGPFPGQRLRRPSAAAAADDRHLRSAERLRGLYRPEDAVQHRRGLSHADQPPGAL
jgi:hypothetical protein